MITARRLRPCLLYTPPVAPTDLDGLASCPESCIHMWGEVPRACPSGGRRSRNKAAVGEPAAGSFPPFHTSHLVATNKFKRNEFYGRQWTTGLGRRRRT